MATTPISELNNMLNMNVNQQVNNTKNNSKNNESSFQDAMASITKSADIASNSGAKDYNVGVTSADMNKTNQSVNSTDTNTGIKNNANSKENQNSKAADSSNRTSKSDNNKISEEDKKAVSEAEEKIAEDVAEKLGISKEELLDLLNQMGLTIQDLMNPENVSNLVADIKADGDLMALVTDESLQNLVQDLNQLIAQVIEEASALNAMEPDEFSALMSDVLTSLEENSDATMVEIENLNIVNEDSDSELRDGNNLKQDDISDNGSDNVNNISAGNNQTITTSQTNQKENNSANEEQGAMNQSYTVDGYMQLDGTGELQEEAPLPTMSNTQEIMEQMAEHIRTKVTSDLTEISMQLNPESLGTVGLTVSVKEGNMTAHFTTQNEAVQAALESQIAELKENLEQQGVRVEAVEVTVASHEFEQNLEQGNDSNAQEEEEKERLRKATRKIDIDALVSDEDIEELGEEEIVTAEMMKADGNKMDYKV